MYVYRYLSPVCTTLEYTCHVRCEYNTLQVVYMNVLRTHYVIMVPVLHTSYMYLLILSNSHSPLDRRSGSAPSKSNTTALVSTALESSTTSTFPFFTTVIIFNPHRSTFGNIFGSRTFLIGNCTSICTSFKMYFIRRKPSFGCTVQCPTWCTCYIIQFGKFSLAICFMKFCYQFCPA